MRKTKLFINVIFILMLLVTALGNPSMAAQAKDKDPNADPNLLQLANEHPDYVFPVIVQKELKNKDLPDDDPEAAVEKANGKVNREKKMDFIASFSADLTGREIEKLARNPKVRWISLDAPLFSTAVPGFGTTGKVTTPIGSNADEGRSMAVQADGKIVVAGISSNGTDNDFAVARYNTNGTLDTTFDGDGKFTRGWGFGHDEANAVAIQSDGKIVVAGTSYNGTAFLYTLLRLNSNGSLDTTFDSDGIVTTAVNTKKNDIVQSVVIQSNGKIVAAGQSYNGSNDDFSLVRYNSNGSLDTSFNSTGKVVTAFGTSHDYIFSAALQADGKIVVAGNSYNGTKYNFALARYNTNGSLDTTFGTSGKVTTSMTSGTDRAYGMILQSDGKILVAGESNFDFGLARYNTNGTLDTTFDGDGKVTTPIGSAYDFGRSVVVQPNGKILVAGYGSNGSNNDFALVRYNTNGALDTTFDGDGKLITALGASQDIAYGVKVQSDGKILMAGYSYGSNNDFAVVRYNTDGGLDCSQCIDTGNLANVYNRTIGADRLWNAPGNLQGQGITVAVVDSGINAHTDLQVAGGGNSRLVASTTVRTGTPADDYGHGSHVAGVITGNGNIQFWRAHRRCSGRQSGQRQGKRWNRHEPRL